MAVLSKKVPFYNKPIEKSKVRRSENIDRLVILSKLIILWCIKMTTSKSDVEQVLSKLMLRAFAESLYKLSQTNIK